MGESPRGAAVTVLCHCRRQPGLGRTYVSGRVHTARILRDLRGRVPPQGLPGLPMSRSAHPSCGGYRVRKVREADCRMAQTSGSLIMCRVNWK